MEVFNGKLKHQSWPKAKQNANSLAAIADLISNPGAELSCVDHKSATTYLITSDRISVFSSQFPDRQRQEIVQSVKKREQFKVDGYQYSIAPSLTKEFLKLLNFRIKHDSIDVFCVTMQSYHGIERLLSKNEKQLAALVAKRLPKNMKVDGKVRQRDSRELGRKIGYAAKDLAALRASSLTTRQLAKLEKAGNQTAREAISKASVMKKIELEELRRMGTPPAVAYLTVKLWRMLSVRPADDKVSRKHYLTMVPKFFDCLLTHDSTATAITAARQYLYSSAIDSQKVFGVHLSSVVMETRWSKVIQTARDIENDYGDRDQWQVAAESLGSPVRSKGAVLPKRVAQRLEGLRRKGPKVAGVESIESFGLTGLEIGNWVNKLEGEALLRLVTTAFHDLVNLIGPTFISLAQQGSLALALGARGCGNHCATYNPKLKVVNLTKTKGDGSLAHEIGHYLDHILALAMPNSEDQSLYLSGNVLKRSANSVTTVVDAMSNVMFAIQTNGLRKELVASEVSNRRYREKWILSGWKEARKSPQKAFDLLAAQDEKQFVSGKDSRDKSKCLVNSIAKWTGQPVEIEIRYLECTKFFQNAHKLPKYWHQPHELFARAFESFIEDSLLDRGWVNEFLVSGTRDNYGQCRGTPYPQGDERKRINKAIGVLIEKLKSSTG